MTAEHLTILLAERVLHWRATPDRFLTGKRGWLPKWRFQPLASLEDAFRLLDMAADNYTVMAMADGPFTTHVSVGDRVGSASGKPKAATITVALARAIGIEVPDNLLEGGKE